MNPADSMTITINFAPATLEQLQAEARATGKDVETVVREAVEAKLMHRKRTFAEILKPIHDAVDASGMTPEEAEAFCERELSAMRAERKIAKTPSTE